MHSAKVWGGPFGPQISFSRLGRKVWLDYEQDSNGFLTVWATAQTMAELFACDLSEIEACLVIAEEGFDKSDPMMSRETAAGWFYNGDVVGVVSVMVGEAPKRWGLSRRLGIKFRKWWIRAGTRRAFWGAWG